MRIRRRFGRRRYRRNIGCVLCTFPSSPTYSRCLITLLPLSLSRFRAVLMSLLVICRYIYTASPIHPKLGIRRLDPFLNLCISVTGKLSCHLFPSIRHPSFSSPPRAQPSFRRGDLLTFTFALGFLSLFSLFVCQYHPASCTLLVAPRSSLFCSSRGTLAR
jgi:hypothetical protein